MKSGKQRIIIITKLLILFWQYVCCYETKIMMRNREKLLIGITALLAVGLAVFIAGKSKKDRMLERLDKIAEEGYETAADILYPLKNPSLKKFRSQDNYW